MVHIIPALKDNYIYAVQLSGGTWAIIDPSLSEPVIEFSNTHQAQITYILNTHHHWDHTDGNAELKARTQAHVICSTYDLPRIPSADQGVSHKQTLTLDGELMEVLEVPGHTLGHIAFYFPRLQSVFVGDTLFSMGCGRLFEGTPTQMQKSLELLLQLPADTQVYCGHEYTLSNLNFALSLDHSSPELVSEIERISHLRSLGQPSLPTRLDHERKLNPFLRWNDPELRRFLNMENASPVDVFARLRKMKDEY